MTGTAGVVVVGPQEDTTHTMNTQRVLASLPACPPTSRGMCAADGILALNQLAESTGAAVGRRQPKDEYQSRGEKVLDHATQKYVPVHVSARLRACGFGCLPIGAWSARHVIPATDSERMYPRSSSSFAGMIQKWGWSSSQATATSVSKDPAGYGSYSL